MLKRTISIAFFSIFFFLTHTNSMIMRNNALMHKMVSKFQGKDRTNENNSNEPKPEKPDTRDAEPDPPNKDDVISMMQNVLCRNFPTIPCALITKDPTLRNLIEKSVQQIKYKKITMDRTTASPNYQLSLFPVINSDDLSHYFQDGEAGFFKKKNKDKSRKKIKKSATAKNFWSHEVQHKKKESKTATFSGRKKIRKFYPHKIKYKDKSVKQEFTDYSEEKLSMSVEVPEVNTGVKKRKHFSYRAEPSDPPVWRIDYMKHGEPSLNMFGYGTDSLKGKIIKTGPNVIVDDNILEQAVRRDVLHPDLYIKKNYVRKSNVDLNSEAID